MHIFCTTEVLKHALLPSIHELYPTIAHTDSGKIMTRSTQAGVLKCSWRRTISIGSRITRSQPYRKYLGNVKALWWVNWTVAWWPDVRRAVAWNWWRKRRITSSASTYWTRNAGSADLDRCVGYVVVERVA